MAQFQSYLVSWRNRTITFGGKAQLIEFVLMGKLMYWFQEFEFSLEVSKRSRSIIDRFLWGDSKGMP